jgi:hypothetical protein
MSRLEKTGLIALLGVTALALAALAFPSLVVIGFFLLIVPGVILAFAPAVALYGWLFAVPYAALRSFGLGWWKAALVALLVPLAFGWGRPAQTNATTRANLAAAVATDIRPAQPLPIGGSVALVRDESTGGWHEGDNSCDDLCLRLLYNGNARTVYIGQLGRTGMAYTIERRPVCPRFAYTTDAEKWHSWPSPAAGRAGANFTAKLGLKEVVEARVAGGDCLVQVGGRIRPDWTIERVAFPRDNSHNDWSMAAGAVQGERITVYRRESTGMKLVGRFTNAYAAIITVPLTPAMVGGIENSRWTWGRTTVGESRWDWDSVTALRSLVAFDAEIPEGTPPARMRELLARALADPRRGRDDAGLLLANSIVVDIVQNGAQTGDAELLARAVADPRFTKIDFNWELAKKLGDAFLKVGEAALNRLIDGSNTDDLDAVGPLSALVTNLPDRSFIPPPTRVVEALRDPDRADRLHSVIKRMVPMGDAAVPILAQIVDAGARRASTLKDSGYDRNFSLRTADIAVRELCKLGPSARTALPTIQAAWALLDATSKDRNWRHPDPGKFGALYQGQKIDERRIVTLMALSNIPISAFTPPRQPSVTTNGSWQRYVEGQIKNFDCSISGAAADR